MATCSCQTLKGSDLLLMGRHMEQHRWWHQTEQTEQGGRLEVHCTSEGGILHLPDKEDGELVLRGDHMEPAAPAIKQRH